MENGLTKWSEWKNHSQGQCPVSSVALVRVKMGNGDVLSPMLAMDVDWDFIGDPVVQYQVKVEVALDNIKKITEATND